MQLTAHQLAALRRIAAESGVWRRFVYTDTFDINSKTLGTLVRRGLLERRRQRPTALREYRLTDAGRDAVREAHENDMLVRWAERCRKASQESALHCAMWGHDIKTIPGVEGAICVCCGWQPTPDATR